MRRSHDSAVPASGTRLPLASSGDPHATTGLVDELEQATQGLLALNIEVLNEVETTVGLTALRALKSLERHGPQQVSELGKDLTLNSSTASRLSDRLAGAGYITRRVSPTNRRATLLELTAEGQRVLDKLVSLRIQAFQSVVHRMTPEDIDALIRGARAFTEIERAPAESVSEHSSILEQ